MKIEEVNRIRKSLELALINALVLWLKNEILHNPNRAQVSYAEAYKMADSDAFSSTACLDIITELDPR